MTEPDVLPASAESDMMQSTSESFPSSAEPVAKPSGRRKDQHRPGYKRPPRDPRERRLERMRDVTARRRVPSRFNRPYRRSGLYRAQLSPEDQAVIDGVRDALVADCGGARRVGVGCVHQPTQGIVGAVDNVPSVPSAEAGPRIVRPTSGTRSRSDVSVADLVGVESVPPADDGPERGIQQILAG